MAENYNFLRTFTFDGNETKHLFQIAKLNIPFLTKDIPFSCALIAQNSPIFSLELDSKFKYDLILVPPYDFFIIGDSNKISSIMIAFLTTLLAYKIYSTYEISNHCKDLWKILVHLKKTFQNERFQVLIFMYLIRCIK